LVAAFYGGERWTWAWQLALWGGLVAGAASGAWVYGAIGLGALWIAAGGAATLAMFATQVPAGTP
ncbi:MAG TPA: hypothetical protein VGN52_08475, partial [Burkholderiales bacterium]